MRPTSVLATLRKHLITALLCAAALGTAGSVGGNDDCVKLVFNALCLGGAADTLPEGAGAVPASGSGELNFAIGGKNVHVELDEGRIVHVWREEPPGSWISYLDWRNKLIRIYGRGTEETDFPPSATSRSSRLNAVVRGEGRATTLWGQEGWQVSVIWDKQEYVQLSYHLSDPEETGTSGSEGL